MAPVSWGAPASASFLAVLALAALATPAFPQPGGTIRGTVMGPDGHPVANVEVVLESRSGPARRYEVATNDKGQFVQIGVPRGPYAITFEKEGFGTLVQEVTIRGRETVSVDVRLLAGTPSLSEEEREKRERAEQLKELFAAGLAAIRAGRYDEAIAHLTSALEADPDCAGCHYNMGIAYLQKREYADAEAAFKTALDAQPDYPAAYQGLADVYNAQRKFDEAVEAAAQAAKLSGAGGTGGRSADTVFDQGLTFWNAGRIAEAKQHFQETLTLNPNHGEAHYWLGMATLNEGKTAEAANELKTYLERNPNGRFAAQATAILEQIQPD